MPANDTALALEALIARVNRSASRRTPDPLGTYARSQFALAAVLGVLALAKYFAS